MNDLDPWLRAPSRGKVEIVTPDGKAYTVSKRGQIALARGLLDAIDRHLAEISRPRETNTTGRVDQYPFARWHTPRALCDLVKIEGWGYFR